MAFKPFSIPENQNLWNQYAEQVTAQGRNPSSLAQYKPALINLEELTSKPLNAITAADLQLLDSERQGRNMAHVRAFFTHCINAGWIPADKNLIVYLVPDEYKQLVVKLLQ